MLSSKLKVKAMQKAEINAALDTKFEHSDVGVMTFREFFKELLQRVWHEGEGFSGKRAFVNSGWEDDVYKGLAKAGLIEGQNLSLDDPDFDPEDEEEEWDYDSEAADKLIFKMIDAL